jgi:hypothetical protein
MASNPMVYLELTKRASKHKRTGAVGGPLLHVHEDITRRPEVGRFQRAGPLYMSSASGSVREGRMGTGQLFWGHCAKADRRIH